MPVADVEAAESRPAVSRRLWTPSSLLVVAFSVSYLVNVYIRSKEKYLWFDEIFTLNVSTAPSVRDILAQLSVGMDFNPPAFYLIHRALLKLFGEGRFVLRLPEIVSFWTYCVSLFYFVRRRSGDLPAFVAMCLPVLTGIFFYAFEARPHGIVLGFCGLALLCWQRMMERDFQKRWVALFALSLLGAILQHTYAFLLVFPFAGAQACLDYQRRALRWRFWIPVFGLAVAEAAVDLPLLRAYRSITAGTNLQSLAPPTFSRVLELFQVVFGPCLGIVFIVLVVLVLGGFNRRDEGSYSERFRVFGDALVGAGFVLLPFVGFLLSKITHSTMHSRYFVSVTAGLSICLGISLGARSGSGWGARVLAVIVALTLGWQTYVVLHNYARHIPEPLNEWSSGFNMNASVNGPLEQYSLLVNEARDGLPIGILEPLDFMYLVKYAPSLAPRMRYIEGAPDDFFFGYIAAYAKWSPTPYEHPLTREQLIGSSSEFFVYGNDRVTQLEPFLVRGAKLERVQVGGQHFLARLMGTKGLSSPEPIEYEPVQTSSFSIATMRQPAAYSRIGRR